MIAASENPPPLPPGEGRGEGNGGARKRTARLSTHISRRLRRGQTDAETAFWHAVKAKRLQGYKFRRQFPVGPYFADFACVEKMIIVEIDGGQHNESSRDIDRDLFLNGKGYEVVRFWNNDVLENLEGILVLLLEKLSLRASAKKEKCPDYTGFPLPNPLPKGEGE